MIRMKLCGDDEVDLRSFGDVLYKMGKFDLAEKMYHRVLKELPPNDPSIDKLYYSLGLVTNGKGEYDLSLQWYSKSLEITRRTTPSDYISIDEAHRHKNDDNEALKWYSNAIELFKHNNDENHSHMACAYNNSAIIYYNQKEYSKALKFYEKSLANEEKCLSSDHPTIGAFHMNIGSVYYSLEHYDVAVEHYNQSLKIQLKALPPEHPEIGKSYEGIRLVHECKNELQQALTYY